jgi:hypothetical protein
VTQLALFAGVEHRPRPWKVVRKVSKQLYAVLRETEYLKRSTRLVLVSLAYYRNRTMTWPTPAELTRFMFSLDRIPKNESRYVAPRLTELIRGMVVVREGQKVRIGGGICDQLPARICRESGQKAHPVAIREVGSAERRVA